jgi:thiamine biosynthesis lipoprotein
VSALQWRDWSCTVRVVLGDGRPADEAPEAAAAQRAEHLVRRLMDDVARSASRFRSDSDLSRINDARGRLVPVLPLTLELVDVALDAARRTDGACDPTVGRGLVAAGYDVDIDELRARGPAPAGRRVTSGADWRTVRLDRELGRVGVPSTLGLDLGATAKAWTADQAADLLARSLGLPALVALGGDVAVSADGRTWPVLVSEHEGGDGQVIQLQSGGVATSSTMGRTWLTSRGTAHHLIDPRSGVPVTGRFRTATVLAATCVESNAFSTAALVWGTEAPDRLSGCAARLVDGRGRVVTIGPWPRGEVAA